MTEVHDELAREVYGHAIEQVLDDLTLEPAEEQFLLRLRSELQLSDGEAERLWEDGMLEARRRGLQRAQTHDEVFHSGTGGVEVTGVSTECLEAAISNAVETAQKAMNGATSFELLQTRGRLNEAGIHEWHVEVRVRRRRVD